MVHHEVCPVCSSGKISEYIRCTDHFVSRDDFKLFRCSSCSFVFTQDYPDINDIGKYYESDDYISHSDTKVGLANKIYHLVRNIMLRKKRGIIIKSSGLRKGALLDIGSGTGHFGATMRDAGWQVKGIEINKKARDASIARTGLEILSPDLITTLQPDSFDCITLWHVLEHFHDPHSYATEILRMLKPGGLCLVALPNCNSYDAHHFGKYWAAYDVPRHIWHFNPESFILFSEKTGFITDSLKTLSPDVFYISVLSEKYKGVKLSFLTGIIKALPFSFLSLFNRKRSSSVIYLLRKPVVA